MLNLKNRSFGRLVAVKPTEKRDGSSIVWECICSCGKKHYARSSHLISRAIKSYGCLSKDTLTTHGQSGTPLYKIWASMIQRCQNSNDKAYKNYGGRGINVCDRWLKFENFLKDMGEKPLGLTLERIDNIKGYDQGNCKWATWDE